jgi:hypothetical protein
MISPPGRFGQVVKKGLSVSLECDREECRRRRVRMRRSLGNHSISFSIRQMEPQIWYIIHATYIYIYRVV